MNVTPVNLIPREDALAFAKTVRYKLANFRRFALDDDNPAEPIVSEPQQILVSDPHTSQSLPYLFRADLINGNVIIRAHNSELASADEQAVDPFAESDKVYNTAIAGTAMPSGFSERWMHLFDETGSPWLASSPEADRQLENAILQAMENAVYVGNEKQDYLDMRNLLKEPDSIKRTKIGLLLNIEDVPYEAEQVAELDLMQATDLLFSQLDDKLPPVEERNQYRLYLGAKKMRLFKMPKGYGESKSRRAA